MLRVDGKIAVKSGGTANPFVLCWMKGSFFDSGNGKNTGFAILFPNFLKK